ncbi:MAG: hypothetical protein JJU29_17825 [Verrucomicrobia bacterium]|nr:hypothetical protein [Verrucomicrobiota bacterium]MCH8513875.1 hypothetical protein [Kiritimatiellia bacterium]
MGSGASVESGGGNDEVLSKIKGEKSMAKIYPFSEQTRQLLEEIPLPGETHLWLAKVAGGLSGVIPKEACFTFFREACTDGVRHREVPDREIEDAVNLAYGEPVEAANSGSGSVAFPEKNEILVEDVLTGTQPIFDVTQDTGLSAAEVLRGLFLPGELVCAGPSSDRPSVRPLESWYGDAEKMQFIVLNPMRATYGTNKKGDISIRCQKNIRFRRYLVAEFDDQELDKEKQARLITALSRLAPLVLVVDSGGKSLHGWFRVEELGAKDQVRFFSACCALGADRTRWDICGWLRMPGGWRPGAAEPRGDGSLKIEDGGKRQRIVYASRRLADTGYGISAPQAGLDKGNLGGGL